MKPIDDSWLNEDKTPENSGRNAGGRALAIHLVLIAIPIGHHSTAPATPYLLLGEEDDWQLPKA
jgi:hypothetical protein